MNTAYQKMLQAITNSRVVAEEAGGPGLSLASIMGVVQVAFEHDRCHELNEEMLAYAKRKAQDEDAAERGLNMKDAVARAVDIAERLTLVQPDPAKSLEWDITPPEKGVYMFRQDGKAVYVGIGAGRKGLRGRLLRQHLHANYHKSVLRKKVMAAKGFADTEGLQYMLDNFTVAYLPCHTDSLVTLKIAELILIAWHKPVYNAETESP